MNGDHGTSGDWAYSKAQDNAARISRLEEEVKRIRVSLDDLLMALEEDGIITVIGPNDDIDLAMSEAEVAEAKQEERDELLQVWQSHMGRHYCYYEEGPDSGSAVCPTRYYTGFDDFYTEERAL